MDRHVSAAWRVGSARRPRWILVVGGLIAVSVALTGCAGAVTEPPADPTPVETFPTASERPAWYYEEDVLERSELPAGLQRYQDMSLGEFQGLSKQEQWLYVSWLTQYRTEFTQWTHFIKTGNDDIADPLGGGSDADAVLADLTSTWRMAAYATQGIPTPTQEGTCGRLDADAMNKILIASTTDYSFSDTQAKEIASASENRSICPSMSAALRLWDLLHENTLTSESNVTREIDGERVNGYVLEYRDDSGDHRRLEVYILPVENYDGTQSHRGISNAPVNFLP